MQTEEKYGKKRTTDEQGGKSLIFIIDYLFAQMNKCGIVYAVGLSVEWGK
jgi:hypothetical protein